MIYCGGIIDFNHGILFKTLVKALIVVRIFALIHAIKISVVWYPP